LTSHSEGPVLWNWMGFMCVSKNRDGGFCWQVILKIISTLMPVTST